MDKEKRRVKLKTLQDLNLDDNAKKEIKSALIEWIKTMKMAYEEIPTHIEIKENLYSIPACIWNRDPCISVEACFEFVKYFGNISESDFHG